MAVERARRNGRYASGAVGRALALSFMVACTGSSGRSAEFARADEKWKLANSTQFDPFYEDAAYDDVVALLHQVPPANQEEYRKAQKK